MKELSLDRMALVEGGNSYRYWSCNIGMLAAGAIWTGTLAIASFGTASFIAGVAWGAFTSYVCKDAH